MRNAKHDRHPEPGLRIARLWPALIIATVIGVLTLRRLPPSTDASSVWCLVCGELGGLDVFNNVVLFVPFGGALVFAGASRRLATAVGIALIVAIEGLQFSVISGRDASISDLLTNSVGCLLGASLYLRRSRWLEPNHRLAVRHLILTASGFVAVLSATAVLLHPSVPTETLFGQWAPQQRRFAPFEGTIHDVALNGTPIPYGPVPDQSRAREILLSDSSRAIAEVTTGPAPATGVAALARVVASDDEVFLLGQRRSDFVFRIRLRSAAVRFRTFMLRVPGALPAPGDRVVVEGGLRGHTLFARAKRPQADAMAEQLPLAVSLGWAFLAPRQVVFTSWYRLVSAAWLALLALPMGFYLAAAASAPRLADERQRAVTWASAPVALLLGLGVVPALGYVARSHWNDWAGALAGVAAGSVLWSLVRTRTRAMAR